ncbi:MAG TPA: hypothetical protein VH186_01615 [Chloroflexia bacterium]|nr:hypothetical protein [Chloroflexia bacterium]
MRLYYEVAIKAFQRSSIYRLATLTGIVVNAFFGAIICYVYLAVYGQNPGAKVGGYDLPAILSYMWLSQALIVPTQIWFDKEISKTILSGDVVSDFSKPFDYQAFWLSRFIGNSLFGFLFRTIPTYLFGMLFFGAQLPQKPLTTAPLFFASLVLSIGVSFLIGYMVNLSAFWTINASGTFTLMATVQMFFSGFTVPLAFMPDWLGGLCRVLPFQTIIYSPSQIWLEQGSAWLLLPQLLWLLILWWLARHLTRVARLKVTIQGG